ncbi:MAG TPA: hypothetical protein VHM20_01990 [Gammaproteobacteria bacterium]|nr:hypothetical protein [Gammaproteobacteria bacterium]
MKTYFSIIGAAVFLSLCILQQGRAQQSIAYIRFNDSEKCPDWDLKLNSVTILKNGKECAIPINENGFDTLYVDTGFYPIIFRLKNGEHYSLKYSYANFDLFPVNGHKDGMIRFAKKNSENALTVRAFYGKILDTLKNDDTTVYRKKNGNYHNDIIFYKLPPNPKQRRIPPVAVINLIFLHGEKYTVVYDGKTGKINTIME